MQSNSGAIIADTFPPNARGKAYGFSSMGWTIGSMLGIVAGGILATFLGWQYIFFINIPIGVIALICGLKYLRGGQAQQAKLDIGGMFILATILLLICFGANSFSADGLTSLSIVLLSTGVLLIPVFIKYEKRESPLVDFSAFKDKILRNSCLATFFVSIGYISVAFLVIMYLQGVRGLSPLDASLLLVPGYIVGSIFSPFMGRHSDKIGARTIATLGIFFLGLATLVFSTINQTSSLLIIVIASAISGFGTSMFFPANNSAVMAKARQGAYGSISGVLRTLQNVGILGSFVVAISVASMAIPRQEAFQVFINTVHLSGGLSISFIRGIDAALYASIVILAVAAVLSATRGKETRKGQAE